MFVTVLVVARHQWFTADEWDFLVTRKASSISDLLRPHSTGHWSTLPILVYRGLFQLFGLRTYVPYQAVVVSLHLTAAALLRTIMRRADVGPWIATAAASLFAFFGSGYEDIIWAFQMGFVGSLVFGLTQLLLTDHDGAIDRRDRLGLLAGAAGLMCSGVGVVMTVVVGLAVLARRGWRIALFQTVPLAMLYAIWWLAVARRYHETGTFKVPSLGSLTQWISKSVGASFNAMGQLPGVGVVLAVILVVGLVLALSPLDRTELRTRAAVPGALLIGAFIFVVMTSWADTATSVFSGQYITNSHYLHIFVAMVIPAIAIGANAIARRWRVVAPAILAVLVVGIPGNLAKLEPNGFLNLYSAPFQIAFRQYIISIPTIPAAHEVPRSYQPSPFFAPQLTIGWLLDQRAAGRLPDPGPLTPRTVANLTLGLALHQSNGTGGANSCSPLVGPVTRRLEKGQSIGVKGGAIDVALVTVKATSDVTAFDPAADGITLTALLGPLTLIIEPGRPGPLTRFLPPSHPNGRIALCS
jgi:hypothetical protein